MPTLLKTMPRAAAAMLLCMLLALMAGNGCAPKNPSSPGLEALREARFSDVTPADIRMMRRQIEAATTPAARTPGFEQLGRLLAVRATTANAPTPLVDDMVAAEALLVFDEWPAETSARLTTILRLTDDPSDVVRYHALRVLRHHHTRSEVKRVIEALAQSDASTLVAGEARLQMAAFRP
jgi:hypothetical protein